MTTPSRSSDTPTHTPHDDALDCVGHCVGTASETTPRAQRDDCVGPAPLPYGGRHSQRAPLTASATTASTASDTHHTYASNSGLFIDASDCDYCHAWLTIPCALHRVGA